MTVFFRVDTMVLLHRNKVQGREKGRIGNHCENQKRAWREVIEGHASLLCHRHYSMSY
jgi:hypothetical protein